MSLAGNYWTPMAFVLPFQSNQRHQLQHGLNYFSEINMINDLS